MIELQRIQELAKKADAKEVLEAGEVIAATFREQMKAAHAALFGNEPAEIDWCEAGKALQLLHEVGEQYDMAFPSQEDVKAYVIKYGREVILGEDASQNDPH